jgi:ankyrin repeat protein
MYSDSNFNNSNANNSNANNNVRPPVNYRNFQPPNVHLFYAIRNNDLELAQYAINRDATVVNQTDYTNRNRTNLQLAVEIGTPEMINFLITKGANVNGTNTFGITALHDAVRLKKPNIVELLIGRGANVNARSRIGITVMDVINYGTSRPELEIAKQILRLLIAGGADLNSRGIRSSTPIHHAIYSRVDPVEVVTILLDAGADINSPDAEGKTPLDRAEVASKAKLINLLLERGADSRKNPMLRRRHALASIAAAGAGASTATRRGGGRRRRRSTRRLQHR